MNPTILSVLAPLLTLICPTWGNGVIEVNMVKYTNSVGKTADGKDCDLLLHTACENIFTFCLDEARNPINTDHNTCSYKRVQTGQFPQSNDNNFGSDMMGVHNPIQITSLGSESKIVLKVEIKDGDQDSDDLVDTMYQELSVSHASTKTTSLWTDTTVTGRRSTNPTTLKIRHRAYCATDYYGQTCDVYCQATDTTAGGHYMCDLSTGAKVCNPGWTDPSNLCKTKLNPCTELTCTNDRICIWAAGNFTCECEPGYTGETCETMFDPCNPSPCNNDGVCQASGNDFTCSCGTLYTGTTCETHIDFCESDPCLHLGNCTSRLGAYECSCADRYTGTNCETEIDPCDSSPCIKGGSCQSDGQEFSCLCPPMYTGTNCETEVDPCDSTPCINGGSCKSDGQEFSCLCPQLYTGSNCDVALDACISAPCQNGGICSSGQPQSFTCRCRVGFGGSNCENSVPLNSTAAATVCSGEDCPNAGRDWRSIGIGLGVGVGVLVIVVVIIVIVCLKKRPESPQKDRTKIPTFEGTQNIQNLYSELDTYNQLDETAMDNTQNTNVTETGNGQPPDVPPSRQEDNQFGVYITTAVDDTLPRPSSDQRNKSQGGAQLSLEAKQESVTEPYLQPQPYGDALKTSSTKLDEQ